MTGHATGNPRRAFTLTELLTVVGLITLLVSLLIPALAKVRAAADSTACLSNLRQMGNAWAMYVAEHHGRMPAYVWYTTGVTPDAAWDGYWPGLLASRGVGGEALLCPAAREPANDAKWGFGNVTHAWSGQYMNNSAVLLSATVYRESSYGSNGYLTAGGAGVGGFGSDGRATCLTAVRDTPNVPLFFDSAHPDVLPYMDAVQKPPPNLRGTDLFDKPQHWRFLIGRHGRGVNVSMADGSARWARLDDMYMLTWKGDWIPRRLELPPN